MLKTFDNIEAGWSLGKYEKCKITGEKISFDTDNRVLTFKITGKIITSDEDGYRSESLYSSNDNAWMQNQRNDFIKINKYATNNIYSITVPSTTTSLTLCVGDTDRCVRYLTMDLTNPNQDPTVNVTLKSIYANGKDISLGSFYVNDTNSTDILSARLYIDGVFVKGYANLKRYYDYDMVLSRAYNKSEAGTTHTYRIVVEDNNGGTCGSSGRFEVKSIPNSPPVISDIDKDLGNKIKGFSISYQISDPDNDALTTVEKLNGSTIRTINNAPQNADITIAVTDEQLYKFELNKDNKISIEVSDGKGGISYRNYTFRRSNTPPQISNSDKILGIVSDIQERYTVTDMENNDITVIEKVDDIVLRNFNAQANKEYVTSISKEIWIKLSNGQHMYIVEATDSNGAKCSRIFTFTKKDTKIEFTLSKPFVTDIKASKILITPTWEIQGANVKVEVCNNAFDAKPVWEDITKQILIGRHYNFTNNTKTADKWGVNIHFLIEKDPSYTNDVCIKAFGGAFE